MLIADHPFFERRAMRVDLAQLEGYSKCNSVNRFIVVKGRELASFLYPFRLLTSYSQELRPLEDYLGSLDLVTQYLQYLRFVRQAIGLCYLICR